VQRTYNFEFICPDLQIWIIAAVDALPGLPEFRGAAEPFFKDLFSADVSESLPVFAGYEDPDLRVVNAVDLSRPVAAAESSGLRFLSAEDQRNKGALKENPLHL